MFPNACIEVNVQIKIEKIIFFTCHLTLYDFLTKPKLRELTMD